MRDFYFWKHIKMLGRVQKTAKYKKNKAWEPIQRVGNLCPDTNPTDSTSCTIQSHTGYLCK